MAWLTGWLYRRAITITEHSGSTLTDYQIRIDLNSSNFDFSKANPDGSDIRFTDSDGTTLLPYWIEVWDSTSEQAIVWVKVPSIPANGSVTIYMYYGNSSAVSESDGKSVFQIFDDFEDGSTDGWSSSNPETTYSISSEAGYNSTYGLSVHVDNSEEWDLKRNIGGLEPGYIRFYLKHLNYARDDIHTCFRDSSGGTIISIIWRRAKSSDPCHGYIVVGDCSNHKQISLNVWYEVEIKIDYASSTFSLYMYTNGELFAEWVDKSLTPRPIADVAFRMNQWYDISGDPYWNFHFDRLIMGNWVTPEPTVEFGAEETGVISGYVRLPDGTPVSGATVIVIREDTYEIVGVTTSESDGSYTLIVDPNLTYTVIVIPSDSNQNGDIKCHVTPYTVG